MEGVTRRITRSCTLAASSKVADTQAQVPDSSSSSRDGIKRRRAPARSQNKAKAKAKARPHYDAPETNDDDDDDDDASESVGSDYDGVDDAEPAEPVKRVTKRRKISTVTSKNARPSPPPPPPRKKNGASLISARLFGSSPASSSPSPPCVLPERERRHGLAYHRPLLIQDSEAREALLTWFDGVAGARSMPWRKRWIDPRAFSSSNADGLRRALERRAYEVWISEVMLAQTRVAVVAGYWARWMARWPTIRDLAAAAPDDVLAAWRGLGYYARAARAHDAARLVVADPDMRGLLPERAADLEAKIPGVGRYTAGAISAIVFGRAAPMVDGNVLRVLSRQMGVFGDVKADKAVIDVLWAAADALVHAVARDSSCDQANGEGEDGAIAPSDRPGRWGQALMELGSTVCTPKPNCAACPITATCRAYGEGSLLAAHSGLRGQDSAAIDIEDACTLCAPFPDDATTLLLPEDSGDKPVVGSKQGKVSKFFAASAPDGRGRRARMTSPTAVDPHAVEVIVEHARKFPLKVAKKAVREEETLVCAIRRSSTGEYLIQRRPEKGLLAGMWEFPSLILPADSSSAKERKAGAVSFSSDLVRGSHHGSRPKLKHVGELGSVPWLFSHLRLTMHVHMFVWDGPETELPSPDSLADYRLRWASSEAVENESMGTGMRKCWDLVKNATA